MKFPSFVFAVAVAALPAMAASALALAGDTDDDYGITIINPTEHPPQHRARPPTNFHAGPAIVDPDQAPSPDENAPARTERVIKFGEAGRPCSDWSAQSDTYFHAWVQGYWSGVNQGAVASSAIQAGHEFDDGDVPAQMTLSLCKSQPKMRISDAARVTWMMSAKKGEQQSGN